MEDTDLDTEQEYLEYNDAPVIETDHKKIARVGQLINSDGTFKTVIKARRSDFVASLLHLNGEPFSFTGRDYLLPVYNSPDTNILLKTARQVEKSTFLGNFLTVNSAVVPYNKSLYVSPSHSQTRQFSNEKLKPSIEQSPLIKKYLQDSTVSQQVFEKSMTNGSIIFLRSAFRTADRCIVHGEKVYMADGSSKPVELVQQGDVVISYNGKTVSHRKVLGWQKNGLKKSSRLTLKNGMTLDTSFDHRFETDTGIKHLNEMTIKDFVPVPIGYLQEEGLSSAYYEILGLMLGDGNWLKHSDWTEANNLYTFRFNNNDKSLIDYFCGLCNQEGLTYSIQTRKQSNKINYTVACHIGPVRERFLSSGLLGTGEFTKYIPDEVFTSRAKLRDVLRGLFESDGWCTLNTKNRQAEVGFVSGSKELAIGVMRGLYSLGIYATLQEKKPSGRSKNVSYNVKIRSTKHICKYFEEIGFICKQAKLKSICDQISSYKETSAREPDSPAASAVSEALKEAGISYHNLWKKYNISFRHNPNSGQKISRHKIKKIAEITGKDFGKWCDDNILWVQVSSIEDIGMRETYDLSIDTDELFCANGIITKNTRGISARNLLLDEIQDFLGSEIPVIMECTSHFDDATLMMAGTPKSFDNPIESYWQQSTQNEWIVKCAHCGHYNFLDDSNIAPTELYRNKTLPPGPVCSKCFKPIDVPKWGKWMTLSPGKRLQGYRIPQIMVPWIIRTYEQWERLLWKRDNYPLGQFYNEVLGLSYDSASKPITRAELIDCCDAAQKMLPDRPDAYALEAAKKMILIGGVDWGEGNDGSEKSPTGKLRTASYTVFTIGTYINQRQWKLVYTKKYTGSEVDPDYVVKDIARLCQIYNVRLVGADWGHGWGVNNHLIRILGPQRVVQFQYLPRQKEKLKWDPIGFKYQLQRNLIISEMFYSLKQKEIIFPAWSIMEPYAKDILAVFVEYVEFQRQMKYDHKPSDPDDFLHSLIYARLANDIFLGKKIRN